MNENPKRIFFSVIILLCTNFSFGQSFYYYDNGTSLINFSGNNDVKIAYHNAWEKEQSFQLGYGFLNRFNFSLGVFDYQIKEDLGISFASEQVNVKGTTYTSSIGVSHFFKNPDLENVFKRYHSESGLLLLLNIGYTNGENETEFENRFFSVLQYHKAFAEIGFSYKANFFNGNVTFKYSRIKYYQGRIVGSPIRYSNIINSIHNLEEKPFLSALEANFQGEIGIRQVRLIGGLSLILSGISSNYRPPNVNTRLAYAGILLDIDDIFRFRKKNHQSESHKLQNKQSNKNE